MEGRHVGLDFYDLLIEALIDPAPGVLSVIACFRQLTRFRSPPAQAHLQKVVTAANPYQLRLQP
jgi:hypothetical protein